MFIIGKDYYLFAISFKSYPFRNCFPFSYFYYKFASSNNFWAFEPHLHVCIIAHHQRIRCKPSENNDVYHGVTVHFVDNTLDGGPICAQSKFEVKTKSIESLEKRVRELEHTIYPKVIKEISQGRITLSEGKVIKI